jgi:ferredoxin
LWRETTPEDLPREVLEAEIGLILGMGLDYRPNCRIGQSLTLDQLRQEYDAVLLAWGAIDKDKIPEFGLKSAPHGIAVDPESHRTNLDEVFAAGNAIRGRGLVVRSVGDGREVARSIHDHLAGHPKTGGKKPFSSRVGHLESAEIGQFLTLAGSVPRYEDPAAWALDRVVEQAGRCLHCDCRALAGCKLRHYAALYGAEPGRFKSGRRPLVIQIQPSGILYEPGKCIDCGLCVQIVEAAREPLGLTFVGRGFDVRIGVPFHRSLEEALGKVAAQCVAACPTAALAFRETNRGLALPLVDEVP